MRGQEAGGRTQKVRDRITPAHAGKSGHDAGCPRCGQDHPRPCGEKPCTLLGDAMAAGSPPPMRGKGTFFLQNVPLHRITPAHAGKSPRCNYFRGSPKDHPRPCGEKEQVRPTAAGRRGSPPPMRGKESVMDYVSIGIMDHPRPCGEKVGVRVRVRAGGGSPPPMRGKVHMAFYPPLIGITPAHAGKSPYMLTLTQKNWDHPRPCGEKIRAITCRL